MRHTYITGQKSRGWWVAQQNCYENPKEMEYIITGREGGIKKLGIGD